MKNSSIKSIVFTFIPFSYSFVVQTFGGISRYGQKYNPYSPSMIQKLNTVEPSITITNSNGQLNEVSKFASHVCESLLLSSDVLFKDSGEDNQNTFISFTLHGPKVPRKTKNMNDVQRRKVEERKNQLLGRIKEVKGRLISLRDKKKKKSKPTGRKIEYSETLYLQLTIKYFGATDLAKNWELDKNVEQKLLELIIHGGDSSIFSEWGEVRNADMIFHSAELELINGSWKLDLTKQTPKCIFKQAKNKKNVSSTNGQRKESLSHDRPKNVLLPPSALFFQRLGLSDSNGKPKQAKSSKLRQCQKFVEVVSGLVKESMISSSSNYDDKLGSTLNKRSFITHDMGCGRGYLTFALHSHLYKMYHDKFDVQSLGVDMRPKLVKEINSIAADLGSEFEGLRFETGTIENTESHNNINIDILIALHACDTATDDSIFYGIDKNASIIVTAPCCHKEVRKYLNAHVTEMNNDHPYAEILRHNIYKERIAETVTDSMRALLLEIADYDVQVFEFIGGEHTNKNVMITATKRKVPRTDTVKDALRSRFQSLAQLHGVYSQKLARLMGEQLNEKNYIYTGEKSRNLMKTSMPPL